ncbi:MAG TPA: hypothetical protein PLQ36_03290, partial [Candidatus Gracilibacteria bacterium]|nr:hypothetical protein [Candidatus Gracilibacteria bacterium]
MKRVLLLLLSILGFACFGQSAQADTWQEIIPYGYQGGYWSSISMSTDASKILVAGSYRLYYSNNSSLTWNEATPLGAVNKEWKIVKVSANGNKMVAAEGKNDLFISNNGQDWQMLNGPWKNSSHNYWGSIG